MKFLLQRGIVPRDFRDAAGAMIAGDSDNLGSAPLFDSQLPPDVFSGLSLTAFEPRAMAKASQQQDFSALMSAKNGLVHLTANDWALIADKATRQQLKAGEPLVRLGYRTHGLYVLVKGTAAVQIPGQATPRDIGPGEVCGEISFIDELPATADIAASGPLEVLYLDRPTLQSLFELFPHLGSRFYRSLASILSRRLREVIGAPSGSAKDSSTKKS